MEKQMVQPLLNEKRPTKPVYPWTQPPDTFRYKVQTVDTWLTLGARNNHQFDEGQLIWINFGLSPLDRFYTEQVNWYLREYVGCHQSRDNGRNWAFTDDADPGYIFLPNVTYNMDAIAITGRPGLGGVSAPGYSDNNAYDAISKALDIQGLLDMAISVFDIPLVALAEIGWIAIGIAASIAGPLVALGGGYNDALKSRSRQHFFTGFCSSFVMTANGWSEHKVSSFFPEMMHLPSESVFPEKRGTFRKLYNFGLKAGRVQGARTNQVDRRNLFILLRSKLRDSDAVYYSGDVNDWTPEKQRNYYIVLGGILKQIMLDNDLQIKLK
jgi:hypothetical protein